MHPQSLKLEDFRYDLPEDLIAQSPLEDRTASRLLVRQAHGTIEHRRFQELPAVLPKGTLLVYNDSKVLPGRLLGTTAHGGRLEIMLLRPLAAADNRWMALGRPLRKLQEGFVIHFAGGCMATVVKRVLDSDQPYLEVAFNLAHEDFFAWLEREGYIPLPPYIARPDAQAAPQSPDRNRYQTFYAQERGSVAAPTAGLHFNAEVWSALHAAGIHTAPVTLHVGGGTFLPVKTSSLEDHTMHRESFRIGRQTYAALQAALAEKRPIVAIGTTTLRCLESFAVNNKDPESNLDQWQETQLFLYPKHRMDRYRPWALSGLMTNFHQPESSLLMLISALLGFDAAQDLYKEAIAQRYRFLSYGDTSLLWL